MKHASSSTLDDDALRYLRHHALLEGARSRVNLYLNQVWLQLNRLLLRELGGELNSSNWIEVISPTPDEIVGLRWSALLVEGGVTLEVADVRRWTHVSGDRVVFTLSSPNPATRRKLSLVLDDPTLDQAFSLGDQLSTSLLRYGSESSRVVSLAVDLSELEPRAEAGVLLGWMATFWSLVEGVAEAELSRTNEVKEVNSSSLKRTREPRFVSAAPQPSEEAREKRSPFPPTLPPDGARAPSTEESTREEMLRRVEEAHQSLSTSRAQENTERDDTLARLSKEEMLQAVQAQVRQRPGRLIRGGERSTTPVLHDPPRFVPRTLSDQEEKAAHHRQRASSESTSLEIEEGRVHPPSTPSLPVILTEEVVTQPPTPVVDDEVKAPSYIKPLNQVVREESTRAEGEKEQDAFGETQSTSLDAHSASELDRGVDINDLTQLLERVGLPPWRINTYDEGRGQILWLSNGSHIDYNPSGELILGGENQEETQARLSQMGFDL